jgi:hypothetical protein
MNPESDTVIIKEKFRLTPTLRGLVWVVAILGLGGGSFYIYTTYYSTAPVPVLIESYGLDTAPEEGLAPSGDLLYAATLVGEEAPHRVFRRSLSTDMHGVEIPLPATSWADIDGVFSLLLTEPTEFGERSLLKFDNSTEHYEILEANKTTAVQGLVVSADQLHYAYAFLKSERMDPAQISSWTVEVYRLGEAKPIHTIENAISPQFTKDGTELFYMQEDAIYRYFLETEVISLATDRYAPYMATDSFSVADDSASMVFVKTEPSLISVQLAVGYAFVEIGRVVAADVTYGNPVISPDGLWYSLTASNLATRTVNQEVRYLMNSEPLLSLELSDVVLDSTKMLDWYDTDVFLDSTTQE